VADDAFASLNWRAAATPEMTSAWPEYFGTCTVDADRVWRYDTGARFPEQWIFQVTW
jgi:hypothetical protein